MIGRTNVSGKEKMSLLTVINQGLLDTNYLTFSTIPGTIYTLVIAMYNGNINNVTGFNFSNANAISTFKKSGMQIFQRLGIQRVKALGDSITFSCITSGFIEHYALFAC